MAFTSRLPGRFAVPPEAPRSQERSDARSAEVQVEAFTTARRSQVVGAEGVGQQLAEGATVEQQLGAAVLVEQLPAPSARHQRLASAVDAGHRDERPPPVACSAETSPHSAQRVSP